MPPAERSSKTVVVTGDVTIDWNLARRAPRGAEGGWRPDLKARAHRERGGAALLADLIAAAVASPGTEDPPPEVVGSADRVELGSPDEDHFSHSYAVWTPSEAKRGERRRVWRVDPPVGLDRARADHWVQAEWERLASDLLAADVIALDDANLGFRRHSDPELWRRVAEGGRNPWILLKAARPVAEGPLWEGLREHCGERLVTLMTIDDLRGTAVQISRELSWERTAQDLYWELVHNPLVNGLSLCAHTVVSFGAAGAILLSRAPDGASAGVDRCSLLFDPEVVEGTWEAERPGAMIGMTSCLAAALVRELALASEEPDVAAAIKSGVSAARRLYDEGYGEADEGLNVAFPTAAVVEELSRDGGRLEQVEVEDPSARLSRSIGSETASGDGGTSRSEPRRVEGDWTILEDRYRGDLEPVAAEVVLRGPEVALQGVPLGRFGKLLTVDRGEIESFRSVRALIAEYARSSQAKPLSIGVFGAPGSGKSFGIVQVAQSVDPGRISDKIEFNLSQFDSIDDLHDALHQVRDIGLSGTIPLVFWDEFDAAFEGDELGWLRYFLAPMQDGAFRQGQVLHPVGRAIFVFAGGTSERMESFGEGLDADMFRNLKGPDFISRLKGNVNVLGPNPRGDRPDPHHVIRRAILLRSMLARACPQLFDDEGVLRIDRGVLRAFLETDGYRHGARSMESIVATSRLTEQASYQRSSLPPEAQLDLHVNGREFLALVQRLDLEGEALARLSEAMHEVFCEDLRERGYEWGEVTDEAAKTNSSLLPWDELPEHLKDQSRDAVRDIPEKLKRIGHVMIPARSHDAPFDFPGTGLDRLAEQEHQRYVEAKLAAGWRHGPVKDDELKTSPSLVPWEELPEEEREKDRAQVRGIPRVLLRAGYTVVEASA